MSAAKNKGPVFDPGLCRCCGNMKKCRVLNVEYESCGQKEIYSDMIMDCFGLLLSHLDGSPSERLICATCVNRIRDALSFCRQVLKCEEAFLKMKIYDANDNPNSIQPKCVDVLVDAPEKPYIEVEVVKAEPEEVNVQEHHNDAGYTLDAPVPDDDSSDDDRPLKIVEKASSSPSAPSTPEKKKIKDISGAAALANQIMITRQTFAKKMRRNANNRARAKRPPDGETVTWESPETDDVHMSKIQQEMRERDPGYKRETNILTILEYSYVCPFKCRHNHLLCYYCGELFSDPVLLRDHTLNSHHPKKFKVIENRSMVKVDLTRIDCRLCPIKIDNLDEFRRHVTSVHEKKYYTDIKDAVLPFRLNRDELKCAICDVLFPYFHALNKHMNEHYSNYVCETCGLGFVDHARFMMHQQRHDEGEFPCPTCGKVFKAQYNRDLHVDRVHHKKGRVYCPKCDVKLMSYPQKLKHLVEVHGEQPLSFPCESCDRVFDSRRILTIHRRKDHLKDYRYECQCCGQKFFTRFALTNHMPTHTGERNFKCKVCDKSYPRLKTLKDHMRIHTNDRRFRCHVCGQAFIQNCSLKGHMKSQHPEYG